MSIIKFCKILLNLNKLITFQTTVSKFRNNLSININTNAICEVWAKVYVVNKLVLINSLQTNN